MSHHVVAMDDVWFSYPDGREALAGVTFELHHGECVGLVGANGAGKSTVLLTLAGVHLAQRGVVRIGDSPLTPATLAEVRRRIGVVFQHAEDQLFMGSVRDDVAFAPANQRLPPEEIERRVTDALSRVGASALSDRPPHRLSGGEQRAVALAAVLAQAPDVLLLDEPSASLDPRTRRSLMEWLGGFAHTRVIASHDLDLVLELCERTLVLADGRILADGPTLTLLSDPALLERAGLELPPSLEKCPVCARYRQEK